MNSGTINLSHSHIIFVVLIFTILAATFSCSENPTQNATQSNDNQMKPEKESTNDTIRTIMFFGNSITAGYGLDEGQGFPFLIQDKIDSLGLGYKVVSAGLSGETTAGGLQRVDWMLKQQVDIFVLELGANDGMRGIETSAMKSNLKGIISKVRTKYPKSEIILAAMEAFPNLGEDYTAAFRRTFNEVAEEEDVVYLPFLLDGVAGIEDLNLPDGIHPSADGHRIVASNVWKVLKEIL